VIKQTELPATTLQESMQYLIEAEELKQKRNVKQGNRRESRKGNIKRLNFNNYQKLNEKSV
jgi:hypothetical protein